MNGPCRKYATNNELKITWRQFDDAVMVGLSGQALDVCQFVNEAAYLATALHQIRVPVTKATKQSLRDQMCKKINILAFSNYFFDSEIIKSF